MRVLLTNDDGGPNDTASAYVKYLVEAIELQTNWKLTVCVPSSQKSWIGKAHFAGRNVETNYIYTSISRPDDNSFHGPYGRPQSRFQSEKDIKEWVLIDGTPATCADIGINHICGQDEVDLVLSGPNVGRNSSALYTLSSGTIGGAMEGCHQGKKAIALSYAYDKNANANSEILREASKIAVKLVQHFYDNWNPNTDVYNINVPLKDDLKFKTTKMFMTPIFENKWGSSLFKAIKREESADRSPEADIVDQSVSKGQTFKWSPDFEKVHQNVDASVELTDGKVISEGHVSVTALKAVFKQVDEINEGEFTIDNEPSSLMKITDGTITSNTVVISYTEDSYIYKPIKLALENSNLKNFKLSSSMPDSTSKGQKIFQFGEYEDLDHDRMMSDPNYLTNSYIYRKALIRKHYLLNTISQYNSKHPESILKKAFPMSYQLELDYAEFLDDALDEFYELRYELESNEREGLAKTYILKPSMSDKGQGIRLFRSIDELQSIFDSFEEGYDSDEEEGEGDGNGIITSQLRHFIVQDYISKPLLLPGVFANRKFHIRTYVVCKGNLTVYVYQRMLLLFSEHAYVEPPPASPSTTADTNDKDIIDMCGHLTNTCLQSTTATKVVTELCDSVLSNETQCRIRSQINEIVREVFKAGLSVDKMNFQPLVNSFEIYGMDFIVDDCEDVSVLEVNAYPDFKQTGEELKGLIEELFTGCFNRCVVPFFDAEGGEEDDGKFVKVLDVDNNY